MSFDDGPDDPDDESGGSGDGGSDEPDPRKWDPEVDGPDDPDAGRSDDPDAGRSDDPDAGRSDDPDDEGGDPDAGRSDRRDEESGERTDDRPGDPDAGRPDDPEDGGPPGPADRGAGPPGADGPDGYEPSKTTYAILGAAVLVGLGAVALLAAGVLGGFSGGGKTSAGPSASPSPAATTAETPASPTPTATTAETPASTSGAGAGGTPGTSTTDRKKGGSGPPDQKVRVEVTVLDGDGDPVSGQRVVLRDRSGGTARATTASNGTAVITEGVGPSSCNDLVVEVPAADERLDLGCHNGGKVLERTVEVETDAGGGPGDQDVRVRLTVVDGDGDPVSGEPVVLYDREGDDAVRATTGANGTAVLTENVGPEPCNSLAVAVPEANEGISLGCRNGGTVLERTVELESGSEAPERKVRVELTVVDANGDPVSGADVVVRDLSGGDTAGATTAANGTAVIVEGVGPSPCNSLAVAVPAAGVELDLGCHNGGATVEWTVELVEEGDTTASGVTPVVPDGDPAGVASVLASRSVDHR